MSKIPKPIAIPMTEPEAVDLLARYGIPYPKHQLVKKLDQALRVSQEIGFPVTLKVVSSDILHKSEAGGVITSISGKEALRKAYAALRASVHDRAPGARVLGTLICQQAPDGLEVIVGIKRDPTFGPVILFGLGGIYTEALHDVVLRVAPIQREEAVAMIHEIRAYSLLAGTRGRPAVDETALVELLISINNLAVEHPEINELDLNPVRLYPQGLLVLDARALVNASSSICYPMNTSTSR
jgi:acyl-CoA synthetase (NDP forming)